MGGVKISHHRSRLISPYAKPQVKEIFDAIGSPTSLRCGEEPKHARLRRLLPRGAHRESAGITPRLEWSGQPEEEHRHEDA